MPLHTFGVSLTFSFIFRYVFCSACYIKFYWHMWKMGTRSMYIHPFFMQQICHGSCFCWPHHHHTFINPRLHLSHL